MTPPHLTAIEGSGTVWRVGFKPEPWAWTGWEWAANGRFLGRWDDVNGNFRTVYAGSTLFGCLLEALSGFRIDNIVTAELEQIDVDADDSVLYPSVDAGQVPYDWLDTRTAASATLSGTYCAVTNSSSIAGLYPHFIGLALSLGLVDFDSAALKDAKPRQLTQSIASYLHDATEFDGVRFISRHGDELQLWAIFERPGDPPISPSIHNHIEHAMTPDGPEIAEAFKLLGLTWATE